MAKCTIVFEDIEDDSISTKITFEPKIEVGKQQTPAQIMGLSFLEEMKEQELKED